MDDDIFAVALMNLAFGVLALTIGYIYTLPSGSTLPIDSAPVVIAIGAQ
ncbi:MULTISPECIES: hypothetical protein [Rhizobium/Agrobacterium group]|jgi:hypothetical protein|nr:MULTISPECIES: hypothetical protein [Rhizobium/Agrobacterium group]